MEKFKKVFHTYTGRQLDEIAFPLGGIGTGCISLGGWGQLRDWEIFNRPNKGYNPHTFFALYVKPEGKKPIVRALRGPQGGSFAASGCGHTLKELFGISTRYPPLRDCIFTGMFPMARIDFADPEVPLKISMEAFNPFIPLDEKNSSIPVAIFLFSLCNSSTRKVTVHLFSGIENITGYPETGGGLNEVRTGQYVSGIMMTNPNHKPDSPRYGSLSLTSPYKRQLATARIMTCHCYEDGWLFWRSFEKDGNLPFKIAKHKAGEKETQQAGLLLKAVIKPGGKIIFPIFISWHSPVSDVGSDEISTGKGWKTYSAACFKDAWDVAEYVGKKFKELDEKTRLFTKRLYESTLPCVAIEAAGSQLSVLKSPTCLRFKDGGFWGWEGSGDKYGSCYGTCNHVWNYAQAHAYLFPSLARSVHDQHFDSLMAEDGRMLNRQPLPPGIKINVKENFYPAADGHFGTILRLYREWLISGNDEWLQKKWPKCKKMIEYAWLYWDTKKAGVIKGAQHNTHDIEFWGPNTMIGSLYLGALRAGEIMARHLGDTQAAEKYHKVFESGKSWIDKNLFNSRWYRQIINPKANEHSDNPSYYLVKDEKIPRYQYGEGCLSDQLIGQWYSEILQLGYLFKPSHIRKTLKSIFKYNWLDDVRTHTSLNDHELALPGEAGLVTCTWPAGGEPPYPFQHSTDIWCGIEYMVASHLIYEGFVEEGLTLVKGVRDRHDGTRRNPWDEFECGHHYSRSLASYALILALSGFQYNAHEARIGFDPRINFDNFGVFFCVEGGWGFFKQKVSKGKGQISIKIDAGELPLRELILSSRLGIPKYVEVKINARKVTCEFIKNRNCLTVGFHPQLILKPDQKLKINFR